MKKDLDYTKISVIYKPKNKIIIKSNDIENLILSDEKKEIKASEILKILDYKENKKYKLLSIDEEISNLDEKNKDNIIQIYNLFDDIIKGISDNIYNES